RRRTKLIEPAEVQIQRILERKSFLVEVPQESELSHLILLLRQYISQNTLRSLIGMSSREIRQYAESPSSGAFSELLMLLSALDDLRYSGNALHNWPELARKIKLELLEISRSRGLKK
ncbi:MAG: hypothetical protein KDD42_10140, partial [Bdellovibrionales bacterium]|nr:hypothetical protein [Bdellovibrionales bacterium]